MSGLAQRMPTRRLVVPVLAAALGLGLVAGAAISYVGGPSGRDPQRPAIPHVTVDFRTLPAGRSPVPYWSSATGAIHDGERTIETARPLEFVAYGGRFLVLAEKTPEASETSESQDQNAVTVGRDLVSGVAVAPDGRRIASSYPRYPTPESGALAIAGSLEAKPVTHRLDFRATGMVGWLDGAVVVRREKGRPVAVDAKTGRSVRIKSIEGVDEIWAASPSGDLVAVGVREPGTGRLCGEIRVGSGARHLWRSCDLRPVGFSPDGRYAVARASSGPANGYTVIDLERRTVVLRIDADRVGRFAWDGTGRTLVIEAHRDGRQGLVACSLSGTCTRVGRAVWSDGSGAAERPYVLGR